MLVLITNLISLTEFNVRYLTLFLLFSVIDNFWWFWIGNLYKNIQLMLEFLKAPILAVHFSYYTLMTFLMMLSVILLSILIILLSKCHQASDLWQQLELASELESDLKTLWTGTGSGLLISMLEKLNWFHLTSLITLVLLTWKWMGLFLRTNHLLRCWGWLSLLNWIGALTLSLLLKVLPRKLEPWFVLRSLFLLNLLGISINLPYSHK